MSVPSEVETIAIDPGTKNFAFASYTEAGGFKFGRFDLSDKQTDSGTKMMRLWDGGMFDSADVLLLERQMVSKFKEMVNVLRGLWFAARGKEARLVSPIRVKRYFNTSKGKHRANKLAAIPLARSLLRTDDERRRFAALKKKDDVADCITMIHWWLKTH